MQAHNPPVTGAALSRAVGVSRATVSDWLSGKTKDIKGAHLVKIARALNINSEWLAIGKGQQTTLKISEEPAPYNDIQPDIKTMQRATRFIFDNYSAQQLKNNGAEWTTIRIIKLFDLFNDPASDKLNTRTILKLID